MIKENIFKLMEIANHNRNIFILFLFKALIPNKKNTAVEI